MTQTPATTDEIDSTAETAALIADLRRQVAARDAFIAIASHELRNPMTPIVGQVDRLLNIVQRQPGDIPRDAVLPALRFLHMAAQNYLKRATLLLETSRIASGHLRIDPTTFDLSDLTQTTVQSYLFFAEKARSTITATIDGNIVGSWDRMGVEQILDNLLSNAVKYGAGHPIEVSLRGEADSVWLSVRDRGIGISAEDQARIFGQFEQVLGQRQQGGFGVGLWVVRQLIEAMGGSITVVSRPGEGSTFTISLPWPASTRHRGK